MTIRMGLIGAGVIGKRHAEMVRALPERAVLAAVADPQPDAAKELAEPSGAQAFASAADLIDDAGVDAVIIGTPNAFHYEQVRAAAAGGLHVLVEKPMAITRAECEAMIAACDAAGVVLAVGHMQRYFPDVAKAGSLLAGGVIGALRLIVEQRCARYERGTRADWFFDAGKAGGGIVANLGGHCLDKVAFLAGGWFSAVHSAWSGGAEVPTESVSLLEIDDRVRVTLTLAGTGLPGGEETRVVGSEGALRLSRAGIEIYRAGEVVQTYPAAANKIDTAFTAQLNAFCDAIETGRGPVTDGRYGRAVVEAVEKIVAGTPGRLEGIPS